jgi:hypothetical protein
MTEMEQQETTATAVPKETPKQEYTRGVRGELGTASAGQTLKLRYHTTHFDREDAQDRRNPNKKRWVKHHGAPSLKVFARKLASQGDVGAKDWMECKKQALNLSRSEGNTKKAIESRMATRAAHRKSGSGGKK